MSMPSTAARIPVTVIGGYLGAGKTTLINHLLAGGHGRRLAVLVNDFGAIDIDAKLIAAHDGDTISLANGCVCCTIADALGDALDKVLAMPAAPDQIVIEASGVANPAKIAMYGQGWPGLRLDGIVTVVDGESVRARADDKFVAATVRQQLAAADLLVLHKTDLLAEEQQTAVRHWLRQQAPGTRLLAASFGDLPAAVLLGQGSFSSRQYDDLAAHDIYRTASFQFSGPFDRECLAARIKAWPAGVLRAKGLVYLDDDPGHAHILQLVGRRYSLEQGPAWNGETPASRIVVIGTDPDIDPKWLRGSLLQNRQ
ncbi:MAG: GTP-binding protein [Rhodospirillaceae bacterium]|nr:GTP-binding protein [Rhodospirillaceae bacterium]MBT4170687.1 GTP-binding protein [Rhodospirillaceae bacterium]MBT4562003.1 GTP-binding protein [Rhodospirillaceae bacterium]MBT4745425.1 GTP-binding protein [Rhodospirillaceae bacterium]MBT5130120.1 GTP-binding protein [Rhodospirillaceae bacterium]